MIGIYGFPQGRGIQIAEYTNAHGQEVENYRVGIVRQDFKADCYFDDGKCNRARRAKGNKNSRRRIRTGFCL
jgi:hypothetical protein